MKLTGCKAWYRSHAVLAACIREAAACHQVASGFLSPLWQCKKALFQGKAQLASSSNRCWVLLRNILHPPASPCTFVSWTLCMLVKLLQAALPGVCWIVSEPRYQLHGNHRLADRDPSSLPNSTVWMASLVPGSSQPRA